MRSSTERESTLVWDKSSILRLLLSFRAAASVTHVRLSTPFHDRFNATSFVFTYVHSGQTHLAYEHLGLVLAIQRYRAFQVAAMRVWNALLTSIRASSSYLQGVSTSTEKKRLSKASFDDWIWCATDLYEDIWQLFLPCPCCVYKTSVSAIFIHKVTWRHISVVVLCVVKWWRYVALFE